MFCLAMRELRWYSTFEAMADVWTFISNPSLGDPLVCKPDSPYDPHATSSKGTARRTRPSRLCPRDLGREDKIGQEEVIVCQQRIFRYRWTYLWQSN